MLGLIASFAIIHAKIQVLCISAFRVRLPIGAFANHVVNPRRLSSHPTCAKLWLEPLGSETDAFIATTTLYIY